MMNFTEYGKANNMTDDELIAWIKQQTGMDEEDIRLMLAIERGEVDSDATPDEGEQ